MEKEIIKREEHNGVNYEASVWHGDGKHVALVTVSDENGERQVFTQECNSVKHGEELILDVWMDIISA
ncbi:hypothetical protein ACFQ5D_09125 [Paenibacillus farraposensis]|uniref:Uncharacterized protein n=1 Tax=Paenibacillus farraposensis TaxID=2807095 RepID=A0ABW4DEH5_9BACL|nr:hypothetical protein [Paenibacillus farraposensis]MCC3379919.1 hypothetical protein [Paenibacillus farraposensis]